eukprot:CAMPEP_0181304772 /NCGR_PEP_ID=MMETSP1101-20121128/9343_1 /TAXON_ID=46948 /ORGANISM="Rhodomonas abbreviata, Strain Caron Lab Isolate" /LENGTH=170 /DNA_ID=CAMNT_0023410581 /DNA_START=265 /DNA_END=777 /DNA_ORIENTATION=-
MGLFDSVASKLKGSLADATKEVRVQHILVGTEREAVEIRKKIAKDGLDSFGDYAVQYSTCGSAKKRPDAKLAQLRGTPGEMIFRKGQTDKAFERAAFEGKIGTVQGPVKTKFGFHLIVVRDRTQGIGGSDSLKEAEGVETQAVKMEEEEKEPSKALTKKQLKAKRKRARG